jgi:hypothetical protein
MNNPKKLATKKVHKTQEENKQNKKYNFMFRGCIHLWGFVAKVHVCETWNPYGGIK